MHSHNHLLLLFHKLAVKSLETEDYCSVYIPNDPTGAYLKEERRFM